MKYTRLFQLAVVAIFAAVAIRVAPQVFALSNAVVRFSGVYSVGGGGSILVYCSISPATVVLPPPAKGSQTSTATATLTCYNNTASTLTVAIQNSLMPVGNKIPTHAWNAGTSLSVVGPGSASRVVTFTRDNNDDGNTYTLTFDVEGTSLPQVLDYAKVGFTVVINPPN